MSLKSFHVFFVILATLASSGFCLWALAIEHGAQAAGFRVWGFISGAIAVALIAYGVWFVVRKARRIII